MQPSIDQRASPPETTEPTPRVEGPAAAPSPAARESPIQRALPIYYALLLAILTVVGIYLLFRLEHVLMLLFISLLFAAATARPAAQLERLHIPRALAVVLIYLVAFAAVAAIGWFVLPPLFGQIANLTDNLPAYVERYQRLRETYESLRQQYPALGPFEAQVSTFGARLIEGIGARLTQVPTELFGVFFDLLSVFVISMLLVTTRERIAGFILALVHPDHRDAWERVMAKMWGRIGQYLRAKLIVMAIVGALTYLALRLLGIPYALLLGIVVALGELIPRVGPWLARIPLLGIAAIEGWSSLGLVFGASIVIQNLKGYVIAPVVEGSQLDIHPLLAFVAVLVGSALFGLAGAFIAVPAAAMVQVLFEEVIIPWRRERIGEAGAPGEAAAGAGRPPGQP